MPVLIILIVAITIILVSYIHHKFELIKETKKSSEYLNLKQLKETVETLTTTLDDVCTKIADKNFHQEDRVKYKETLKATSAKCKEINDSIELY